MIRTFLDWTLEGRSAAWLYLVGVVFLIAFLHYGGVPLVLLVGLLGETSDWPSLVAYLVNRLPLVVFLVFAPFWVQLAHKRPWWSIALPRLEIEWWNLGVGALFAALALAVITFLDVAFFGVSIAFASPDSATYWSTFVFAIAFVFMQTTSEELVFRGYCMQAVRRFTDSPVALVVITALLFALPHYPNVVHAGRPWWGLLSYALPAVLFAWMALRTGSLWMPIGWHWLNNFALTRVIVSKAGVAGGADAYVYAVGQPPLGAALVTQIIVYGVAALTINHLLGRREPVEAVQVE